MNKAILVIDMPDSCKKCPLFGDYYADMCCRGLNNRGINYPYPENFRQDWCPLKSAPKPLVCFGEENDYTSGYTDCLDEILRGGV